MTKKIIALVLALCFVFAFAACKKDKDNSDTTAAEANTSANGETIANDESSEAESVSGDESTEAQTDASGNTVAPEETKKGTQGSGSQGGNTVTPAKTLSGTAEIVSYFNTAINNVKPHSKSITSKYLKNSQAGKADLGGLPNSVQSLANKLIASNMGEDDSKKNVTYTSAADKNKNFPVEGQSWSSKLTAANVSSATATPKNGGYVITINVKPDAATDKVTVGGGNTPKAFSVVTPDQIYANAGAAKSMIGDVKIGFRNGKIVATVDANGHVTDAKYYFEWNLSLVAVKSISVSIWFGIEQEFAIKW